MKPESALHAYLSYRDAPAGLRWLEEVGFTIVTRQDGRNGEVVHAEVRLGDVVLMVATADTEYDVPKLMGRSTGGGLRRGRLVHPRYYGGCPGSDPTRRHRMGHQTMPRSRP